MQRATPVLLFLLATPGLLALGCGPTDPESSPETAHEESGLEVVRPFESDWQEWRQQRRADLLEADSWLNLTGLHWLRPESSGNEFSDSFLLAATFGPGPENDVVLEMRPSLEAAPATLGTFLIEPPIRFDVTPAAEADLEVAGAVLQPEQTVSLFDSEASETRVLREVRRGPMSFALIERGGNWALRVRDQSIDVASRLGQIDAWAPKRSFVAEGWFEGFGEVRAADVPNVTPFSYAQQAVGEVVLSFNDLEGHPFKHRLLALGTDVSKPLFLVIADESNGRTTYGGGRYLYAGPPDEQGRLEVDLNRLYNPPCAFTGWATCPLPPRQNRIPFEIEAGEKSWDYPH